MNFRALMTRSEYEELMSQHCPTHWAWHCNSPAHHSIAINWFRRSAEERVIYNPGDHCPPCRQCANGVIKDFLRRDSCRKVADKYLLVMVLIYFKRAHLKA
ncbi:hypothetical protein XELAEV_18032349mg, partial [Xenopus laevis]